MNWSNALAIAVPALALFAIVAVPGELRWLGRPWFMKGHPRRRYLATFAAVILAGAIVHAVS
jgi:hypothetical protein